MCQGIFSYGLIYFLYPAFIAGIGICWHISSDPPARIELASQTYKVWALPLCKGGERGDSGDGWWWVESLPPLAGVVGVEPTTFPLTAGRYCH